MRGNEIFRQRLKKLRKERHETQSELANVLNYGYTAISNYENGRNEPAIIDLMRIAYHYKVTLEYLLEYDVFIQNQEKKLFPYGLTIVSLCSLPVEIEPLFTDAKIETMCNQARRKLNQCPEEFLPIILGAIDAGIATKPAESKEN